MAARPKSIPSLGRNELRDLERQVPSGSEVVIASKGSRIHVSGSQARIRRPGFFAVRGCSPWTTGN
jgi:hypothetical protein